MVERWPCCDKPEETRCAATSSTGAGRSARALLNGCASLLNPGQIIAQSGAESRNNAALDQALLLEVSQSEADVHHPRNGIVPPVLREPGKPTGIHQR